MLDSVGKLIVRWRKYQVNKPNFTFLAKIIYQRRNEAAKKELGG